MDAVGTRVLSSDLQLLSAADVQVLPTTGVQVLPALSSQNVQG